MIYFETDFYPVGTGEKGGDAASLRVWDHLGNQLIFVIDGGTKDSGKAIVEHVKSYYGTSTVDAVISTHPDGDHASGLTEVLENLDVKQLFMHKPWEHADDIKHLFENRSLTAFGLGRKMREELEFAHELKKIAERKGIPIIEPFAGDIYFDGILHILGPSLSHYQTMLPHYRTTPDASLPQPTTLGGLLTKVGEKIEEAVEWEAETMDIETLTDDSDHFSAENSTSAVVLFTLGESKLLYTGDADINALTQAAIYAAGKSIPLTDLHVFDVPHHGSKHNLGPTILSYIKGRIAHISAPPDSPKHPSKKVINALIRRGAKVYSTQGKIVYYRSDGLALRDGWSNATELPFSSEVEK